MVALSLTCFLRVLDVGIGMNMLLYICQLGLYAYFGVYITSIKTKAYLVVLAQSELKRNNFD